MSLALIAGAVGTATSVAGSVSAGNAAKKSSEYNAKIAQQNAEIAKQNATWTGQEGEAQAGIQGLKNRVQMGAIKTAQGASGIDVNKGSAAQVQESQAGAGALDVATIRSNAARRAYGYETEATGYTGQAALDKASGKQAQKAGYINAASTLLTGAAKAGTGYSDYKRVGGLGNAPDVFGSNVSGSESFDTLED